ncbi:MAG: allophanate hydrolase subunit 1 [Parvularculaceae bacterium]|nr:allophanate hydrolase subunit 1 [Parvularculaceae bacterium]
MADPSIETLAEDSLLVAGLTLGQAQALASELEASAAWSEVVQGLDSVAVSFDPVRIGRSSAHTGLAEALQALPEHPPTTDHPSLELPIRYGGPDGPDLERLSEQLAMEPAELIARHQSTSYKVDLIGFMPGFAYLSGLDPRLKADRLPTPRYRLPAGSVGISGLFSGLYPLDSPGGWPIIGRVQTALWDPTSADPFVLKAGMTIRFVSS